MLISISASDDERTLFSCAGSYPPGAALYRRILLRSGNVFGNFGRKVWTFVTIECAEHQLPLHLLTVLCSGSCGL